MTYIDFWRRRPIQRGWKRVKSATSDERFVRVRYMWYVRVDRCGLSEWATKSSCCLSAWGVCKFLRLAVNEHGVSVSHARYRRNRLPPHIYLVWGPDHIWEYARSGCVPYRRFCAYCFNMRQYRRNANYVIVILGMLIVGVRSWRWLTVTTGSITL